MAARKRFGVSRCWTREGKITVLASDGTRHQAKYLDDLHSIPSVNPDIEQVQRDLPAVADVAKGTVTSRPKRNLKQK